MSKSITLSIIDQAIALIRGFFQSNSSLKQELANANKTIADQADALEKQSETIATLRADIAADTLDDQELTDAAKAATEQAAIAVAAAAAAETKFQELDAEVKAINDKAGELAALITEHPETPNVTADFVVLDDTQAPSVDGTTPPTTTEAQAEVAPSAEA